MEFLIHWTYSSDLAVCPDVDQKTLHDYQMQFDVWLHNKSNNHGYWTKNGEGEDALCFGTEAFINWLNEYIFIHSDEKARMIKGDFKPNKEQEKLPFLYF